MKSKKVILLVSLCLIICAGFYVAAVIRYNMDFIHELPQRLYMGDRLTLSVSAKSDGQSVELTEKSVSCVFYEEPVQKQSVRFNRISDVNQEYSISGGQYGFYTFIIHSGDAVIEVGIHNTNWWNVATVNLEFDIDTEKHIMTYIVYDQSGTISAEEDGRTYVLGVDV